MNRIHSGSRLATVSLLGQEPPSFPKLFFKYSFLYDGVCSPEKPVDPAYAKEATELEPTFAAWWEKEAPIVTKVLFDEFGRGMARKELSATLSACEPRGKSTYSFPLVINVTRYLKSYMKEKPVWQSWQFVNTVFHELLHTWVNDNLDKSRSVLWSKYAAERPSVKSHMFLMALQVMVYTVLGRTRDLNWLDQIYSNRADPDYPRAWKIVQEEGFETFIQDLKQFPTGR